MRESSTKTATPWAVLFVLVGAGVISAVQVGKATVALADVQGDLRLSLTVASWLLSAFALVGALAGGPIGLTTDRIGAKRMLVWGLAVQGVTSALGSVAAGASLLLAMRVVEGLGFLCVIIAAPVLIVRIAAAGHRERALSLWATFMPVGITLSLLAASPLAAVGWRGFWIANAVLLLGYGGLAAIAVPTAHATAAPRKITVDIRDTLAAPGPWLLAGLFAAFSASFFAIFGFLPVILTDRLAVSPETASLLTAAAVMASAAGNLVCGAMLNKGLQPWQLLMASFALLGVTGVGVFLGGAPPAANYALSVAFAFVGGFIPVIVMDAVPRHAPRSELIGATMGFVMQGNNVGLALGPAATGLIASAFGWSAVSLLVAGLALAAGLLGWIFRAREMHRRVTATAPST
ncbi:MFS transporter [Bradyrhizobium sp. LHD-71]|nr:MFS transporter [Bradyrhizobium sp. LHD-71]MDQ8731470.1 MFS transporter [Bradyrhizobium sp. LHD-71]